MQELQEDSFPDQVFEMNWRAVVLTSVGLTGSTDLSTSGQGFGHCPVPKSNGFRGDAFDLANNSRNAGLDSNRSSTSESSSLGSSD
jgi:hypothetical protein